MATNARSNAVVYGADSVIEQQLSITGQIFNLGGPAEFHARSRSSAPGSPRPPRTSASSRRSTGSIRPILSFDLTSISYVPLNAPLLHVVFCEGGTGIDRVMIGGTMVVERGAVLGRLMIVSIGFQSRAPRRRQSVVYAISRFTSGPGPDPDPNQVRAPGFVRRRGGPRKGCRAVRPHCGISSASSTFSVDSRFMRS
jgi:hypothetical protein